MRPPFRSIVAAALGVAALAGAPAHARVMTPQTAAAGDGSTAPATRALFKSSGVIDDYNVGRGTVTINRVEYQVNPSQLRVVGSPTGAPVKGATVSFTAEIDNNQQRIIEMTVSK